MDTTDDIVAVETEYASLLNDPRRQLSRFVEVSLAYGRMLAELDPLHAAEVYTLAVDTLHDPPAPAEVAVALDLIRALRPVAARLGSSDIELDAIARERRLLDHELAVAAPGVREALCRRAAAVRFSRGEVADGFAELMNGLRNCGTEGLDELATDLVLAVRRLHVPVEMMADVENMWVELRRRRFDGNWPLWCLTALGALRLDMDDVLTAQMYLRRAESILGHLQRPVAGALVGGWVALAAEDFDRAHDRFTFAANTSSPDERMRLLASAGLGESLICLGRIDEARAPLAEAIAFEVGDPQSVARCHELLAEIAAHDGRHGDAYEHLQVTRRFEQVARGEVVSVTRVTLVERSVAEASAGEATTVMAATATPASTTMVAPDVVDLRDAPTEPIDLPAEDPASAFVAEALANRWIDLHYQPIVDNTRGRAGAAEAFLRVSHPEHGDVAPDRFLGAMTDRRVAEDLCLHTIGAATEAVARWVRAGAPLAVVVNVSESQLTPALPVIVRTALGRSGAPADLLTIEVDGDAAGRIDAERIAILNDVRSTGARIGIDRFGGEFRSIDTLLRLPVDVVKLDHSVFGGGTLQPLERRMVDTVVALARAFGFEVVATGIETEAQFVLQQDFGCHGAQGYLLGAPAPEAEFVARLLNVA